uniref:Uncharacterized protein n=1 Tax=Ascaris lumbricoides TaxID=6252 RepID=A0A0M3INH8_ASCLU
MIHLVPAILVTKAILLQNRGNQVISIKFLLHFILAEYI